MASTGLSEFREVLSDFRQLLSFALKAAVVLPLADIGLRLGPPPSAAVGALTSLIEFLVFVWVFQFWFDAREGMLRVRMKVALGFFLIGLLSSLLLLGRFSISPGQGRERVIEGLSLRSDVRSIINNSYSPEQAVRDSEYDPEKVWTKESIAFLRTFITVIWIGTFTCLAVYLNVFIILPRRRRSLQ